ncbi:erythromycin esterase family protein [Streptomyces sp. G6]|uniref:erythromycin esterase family protein n=1 Tax=Streptomyces sp. G6 TaxID=1178736 RepID=UPI003ED96D87
MIATAIAQGFTAYAFPDEQFSERMRYRDRARGADTARWLRHEGGRVLLASNNGHIAYTGDNPEECPEPAGSFLCARRGADYVNIGLTFDPGTVNALPDFTAQRPESCTVAPAPAGHNEHTLDKVRHRDFSIDPRTASRRPAPGSPRPAPPAPTACTGRPTLRKPPSVVPTTSSSTSTG